MKKELACRAGLADSVGIGQQFRSRLTESLDLMKTTPAIQDLTDNDVTARWAWLEQCMKAWERGFDYGAAGQRPESPVVDVKLQSSFDAGVEAGSRR